MQKYNSYSERSKLALNPTGSRLLALMDEKKSNLALSADVTSSKELLSLAEKTGSEICLLKTHIDILEDFTSDLCRELLLLTQELNFLIFEDRKFADIGNTVKRQYQNGIYRISDWADIVNAHLVPGPGIIEGLKEVGLPKKRGLLLLAQMSSEGTLAKGSYTKHAVQWAEENTDFVVGFICREKISDMPELIHCTPGVHLSSKKDSLKQQYLTPAYVIQEKESDLIIVGRGIYESTNPKQAAAVYREEGYNAYLSRL